MSDRDIQLDNSKTRPKKIDLFETAKISKNILASSEQMQQYTDEIVFVQPEFQVPMQSPIRNDKKLRAEQTKPTQIYIAGNNAITPRILDKSDKQKPKASLFIFEDEDDSQEDAPVVNEDSADPLKIIFEHNKDSSDEQPQRPPPGQKKAKSTIQLFGEKVEIPVDSDQDQDRHQPVKQEPQPQLIPQPPRELLQANTIMAANTFAKLTLIRKKQVSGGPILSVYLQSNNRFIVSCRNTSGQTYILSDREGTYVQQGNGYMGKVKASFFGSELSLYSNGLPPVKAKQANQIPREVICTVVTQSQPIMEEVKPRDFKVYMLRPGKRYYKDLVGVTVYGDEKSLKQLYENFEENKKHIILYENRKSSWNEKQKMHSLNMKGRARLPSIKNFILESPSEGRRQIMLFGKMEENEFSFDIHHPLTPNIGMAVAISSFTYKTW